jgi:hypothetical protein
VAVKALRENSIILSLGLWLGVTLKLGDTFHPVQDTPLSLGLWLGVTLKHERPRRGDAPRSFRSAYGWA